ncbi:MAG: dihydroorotate dehydrogenase [Vampirovibrionales bacterium]
MMLAPCLKTSLATLSLATPLMNASGTFCPETYSRLAPLTQQLGVLVTKTVTPQGSHGNAQQRTVELPGVGMLNSIGLQGKGLTHTLEHDLPVWQTHGLPVALSISAPSPEAFAALAFEALTHPLAASIGMLELNLSCPNVKAGGSHFGADPLWVSPVVQEVKAVVAHTAFAKVPVFVKLTPNVANIVAIAEAALLAGADGLVAINTVLGCHIDIKCRTPSLSRVSGGYSGPGIKPIAIHALVQLATAFPNVPIVGVGGIRRFEDVLEFVMAGAAAVQVGTSCFANPSIFLQMNEALTAWCEAEGVNNLAELRACAIVS